MATTQPLRSPADSIPDWEATVRPLQGAFQFWRATGIIVGLMARYGSKRIRGHGIPEAIEAILIQGSRVEPRLAFLKPLSSAISIGSGGTIIEMRNIKFPHFQRNNLRESGKVISERCAL